MLNHLCRWADMVFDVTAMVGAVVVGDGCAEVAQANATLKAKQVIA